MKFLDYNGLQYFWSKLKALFQTKQDTLVSGTNIKTINGSSILGSGDIQAGDPDAVKYVSQALTSDQKSQARSNISAQESLVSGTNIKTINQTSLLGDGNITIEDGVGFASVSTPSTPDGTVTITLTNGDTITLSLSHDHPQYLKYVMLTDESQMPANPDSTTLYMWPEAQS